MASDLSFNIIASDRASATLIKLGDVVDRLGNKIDAVGRKDVTANVNIKTDESSKALDSLTNRMVLLSGAVIAASPIAGVALVAGIGGGFITVAALAQKSNLEVQASFRNLSTSVVQQTKAATDQLVPQFVGAANAMNVETQKLGPLMKQAFSAAGPDIVALTNSVTGFATNVMPGATSAMQNSLPVFIGVENAANTLGTAFGDSFESVGQHANEYGTVMTSVGSITGSVLTNVVSIVNTVGTAWAENATEINGAVAGVTGDFAGLANGALPVLVSVLDVGATAVHTMADALGPLAPILGTTASVALATWAAFKIAGLVTSGINALAMGVVTLGGNLEAGAAKSATFIAAQQGVAVESSVAATAVRAAGVATATAAVGFSATAAAIAGPLGIALVAGTVLLSLFSSGEDKAKASTDELKQANTTLVSALESSHGAFNQQAIDALKSTTKFKELAEQAKPLGISQQELTDAITKGGPALDALNAKLGYYADFLGRVKGNADRGEAIGAQANAAKAAASSLSELVGVSGSAVQSQKETAAGARTAADALYATPGALDATMQAAARLGLPLDAVQRGFKNVVATGQGVATDLPGIASKFNAAAIAVEAAQDAMASHFATVDKAVVSAKSALSDASHSYAQSLTSIADAEHSAQASSRALADAKANVGTATQTLANAQNAERLAEAGLHTARQQAVQDLKDLHLQLENQYVSEESAQVRLFEAGEAAKKLGVTPDNVKDIASQDVSAKNLTQVKAAIDLLSAQNSVNDAQNNGLKLRDQVSAADAAGVDGSKAVASAQDALTQAHNQVISAQQGLVKAQQQVSDAAYAEKRAHDAVRDAQYQSATASDRLRGAKDQLRDATAAASRSLDINTEAGRANIKLLDDLDDAINTKYGKTAEGYKAKIDLVAGAFGLSRDKAQEYLTKIGEIPADFKYNVTAVAGVDASSWASITASFAPNLTPYIDHVGGAHAAGGPIFGPGGPTDDQIPAWLSNNEHVWTAAEVEGAGGHGNVMRLRSLAASGALRGGDGSAMPAFATGGAVTNAAGGVLLGLTGAGYQSAVNALTVMGMEHPPGLPKYVPPPVISAEAAGAGGAYYPGSGVARWSGTTLGVMAQLGVPDSYLSPILRRMNQESGGNPNIVNKWDANWKAGHPSVGLMQVIGPTFRANAGPYVNTGPFSYGTSVDPVANIYAGLNYAGRNYGGSHGGYLGGMLYAMNKGGGYDNGGPIQPGWTSVFNGTGRPENVRTGAQEDELLTAVKQIRSGGNTFNLHLHDVGNRAVDLRRQFEDMVREAGV